MVLRVLDSVLHSTAVQCCCLIQAMCRSFYPSNQCLIQAIDGRGNLLPCWNALEYCNMCCGQQACVSSSHVVCTLQLTSLVLFKAAMHICVRRPVVNSSSVPNQLASKLNGSRTCNALDMTMLFMAGTDLSIRAPHLLKVCILRCKN